MGDLVSNETVLRCFKSETVKQIIKQKVDKGKLVTIKDSKTYFSRFSPSPESVVL